MERMIIIILLVFPAAASAEPSVKFETTAHDFGVVKQGKQLEHTFEFENAGTEDLIIRQVLPS